MTVDPLRLPDMWGLGWADVDPAGRPGFDPVAEDLARRVADDRA